MTAFPSHTVTWSQHRYVQLLYYYYHSLLPPWHRPIIICPSVFLPKVITHPSVTFILTTSFMRTIHTRVLWNIDHQKRWGLDYMLGSWGLRVQYVTGNINVTWGSNSNTNFGVYPNWQDHSGYYDPTPHPGKALAQGHLGNLAFSMMQPWCVIGHSLGWFQVRNRQNQQKADSTYSELKDMISQGEDRAQKLPQHKSRTHVDSKPSRPTHTVKIQRQQVQLGNS